MGKSGGTSKSWLSAVKKAFRSPNTKGSGSSDKRTCRSEDLEQQEQEKRRGKRRWIFGKSSNNKEQNCVALAKTSNHVCTFSEGNGDGGKTGSSVREADEEQNTRAIAVAMATAAAAEAAAATAQAAVEFIRITRPCILVRENQAAITIQKAFKGYLARRASRALKGVVLLQALIRGHNVRKRTELTLLRMQALIRVQTQVCYQRRRHSVSNERGFSSSSSFTDKTPISRKGDQEDIQSSVREIDSISMPGMKRELAAWKCERDLAHAFSDKIWRTQKEQYSDSEQQSQNSDRADKCRGPNQWERPGRYSCDQRIPIKTVQVDNTNYYPSSNFPKLREGDLYHLTRHIPHSNCSPVHQIPSLGTPIRAYQPELKNLRVRSASPRFLREEESVYPRSQTPSLGCYHRNNDGVPSYMAETESTRARVRSQSVPRQQMPPPTPEREGIGLTKRRLFFGAPSEAASPSCASNPRVQR